MVHLVDHSQPLLIMTYYTARVKQLGLQTDNL